MQMTYAFPECVSIQYLENNTNVLHCNKYIYKSTEEPYKSISVCVDRCTYIMNGKTLANNDLNSE